MLFRSRYGDEYILSKVELDKIRKKGIKKAAKKTVKPAAKPVKTKAKVVAESAKVEKADEELEKIAVLQNQEIALVTEETFNREKFRRNWKELGQLIEAKISDGQLKLRELSDILEEKERLLAIKSTHIKSLNDKVEYQTEEIETLHQQKSLLRQFSEYLRSLFTDLD